jgi:hypothetical protein
MGRLYMMQGRSSEAEALLRHGLELWAELQGRLHPELVGALDDLVRILRDSGRSAEARTLAEWALEVREAAYGSDHEDVKERRAALDEMH